MARDWRERDHPRDPANGEFVEKTGGGWLGRVSDAIGRMRGEPGGPSHSPGPGGRDYGQDADPDYEDLPVGGGRFITDPLDALPDTPGDPPGEKRIDPTELLQNTSLSGGHHEVFNPETEEWETFTGGEASGAGRGGVEHVTGFVDTSGGGFHIAAEPDPADFDYEGGDQDYEQALQAYEEQPDIRIRRRTGVSTDETASRMRRITASSRLRQPVSMQQFTAGLQLDDSVVGEVRGRIISGESFAIIAADMRTRAASGGSRDLARLADRLDSAASKRRQ